MKSFKLAMSVDEAQVMLEAILNTPITHIEAIEMGELSRVFSFYVNGGSYVVHFRDSNISLEKADYMYRTYGDILPIPKVIKKGEHDSLSYIISEKVEGVPISSLSETEQADVLDHVASIFTTMSEIKLDRSKGYGWISPTGETAFNTWEEMIINSFRDDDGGFHHNWTQLYETSFLEREVFQQGYDKMLELLQFAPDHPGLVHGDFHLGNMLSDGKKVTGIVDWEMSMHGDFVLDVAGLHFWSEHLSFPERVQEAWQKKGKEIPHFEERLQAYMIWKAIDGLRFFAKKDDKQAYDYMKARLKHLL